ncbi:lysine-tRNA ligase isoform X2 [Yasminevirus sp. GU-2018]|uniref:lysine--tRNA ligase n=1 Tax=Yasminevirus sp. GU-2018 TaxID=2420051 RepID=A0A5K0U8E6_9VIRU|nr:lysine-tRNA ligase isoform X2 [Yasminevirus sp. GU-2018]
MLMTMTTAMTDSTSTKSTKTAKQVSGSTTSQISATSTGSQMTEQETYSALRDSDVKALESVGLSAYPHKFDPNINRYSTDDNKYTYSHMPVSQFIEVYGYLGKEEVLGPEFNTALIGRVYLVRRASAKLIFIDLHQEGTKVQIMLNARNYLDGADRYGVLSSAIRAGDVIGVAGSPTRTKTGELSLIPHRIDILAMCRSLLPPRTYKDEKTGTMVSGLINQEVRYRQRYLDLMINEDNLNIFKTRSKIIREIRRYLDDELGLVEVDTPILNPSVGGAVAKPFGTHSFDYDCPLFMRIAPELSLKMLIIGGFTGVYELGKQFRNESNDQTHNSEFTSLEFYIQNHDYIDLMKICEHMLSSIVMKVRGSHQIEYAGKAIDFTPPFKRLDMLSTLEAEAKIKLPDDLTTEEARLFLDQTCKDLGVECSNPRTTPRLLDKLVGHFVEPLCINPTFIVGHPQIMSPLAKWDRNGSCRTERFELFINSTEYANAYTELNDPKIQLDTFKAQAKDKDMGDDEAMPVDADFVRALEHGLPPTGGFGLGVDRFVMLLTNNTSIREIILFPTMKPVSNKNAKDVGKTGLTVQDASQGSGFGTESD